MGLYDGIFSAVAGASAFVRESKSTKTRLEELYEKIISYEEEKNEKIQKKMELNKEIEILKKEIETNINLTKVEKMKKQMDLFTLEAEKEKTDYSDDNQIQKEILEKIQRIEKEIYFSIRFNTTWFPREIQNFNRKEVKEVYTEEYINSNKNVIEERRNYVLEKLKSIYEYYKKTSETLKNNEQRLNMLEELIDEMASEVIREDMKKNDVTLPDFVKGMKYFKHENEEDIEDAEIVD